MATRRAAILSVRMERCVREETERIRRLVEHGDAAAEGGEDRGVLAGDHATAEYHHRTGYIGQAQDRVAVEDVFVIDLDRGHVARPGAGRQDDARSPQLALRTVEPLHLDAIRRDEAAAATHQFHLVAGQLRLEVTVLGIDDTIDPVQQRGERGITLQFNFERRGAAAHAPVA